MPDQTAAPLSTAMLQRFFDLTCQLSPENLHCDGEISMAAANRKYRRLMQNWRALEVAVGRQVTEAEVWQAYSTLAT